VRSRFAELMQRPDEEIDLGLAALLIAQEEYADLEPEPHLARLDELAALVEARLLPDMTARERVEALTQGLVWECGFHGNKDDYYDPRNSFLNDVLERRTGIPITLSVVFAEVGRRAGMDVRGVGFPAHFLARHEDVIFDPFHDGRVLTEGDCRELLRSLTNGGIVFQAQYLEPTPAKQIVMRMLNNLKQIYLNARYYQKAIGIMDRLLMVAPASYDELRDRGAVYAELKNYARAQADFNEYLRHRGQAADAGAVREALQNIANVVTLMDE